MLEQKIEGFMDWLVDKGILYQQERIGQYGNRFWYYKFRTFAEEHGPLTTFYQKHIVGDKGRTFIGSLLSATFIDEFPAFLYNYLYRRDIELIGPRALPVSHFNDLDKKEQEERNKYKPALFNIWYVYFGRIKRRRQLEAIERKYLAEMKKAKDSSRKTAVLVVKVKWGAKLCIGVPCQIGLNLYDLIKK